MQLHLTNYTPATDEYEFKAHDGPTQVATIWVTHRNDQSDIVVELHPDCGIPNVAHERMEFLLMHGKEIHRAIKNAMED